MPSFKWRNKQDRAVSISAPSQSAKQTESDASQPARQGSLPSWSIARDRKDSGISLARRFSRQVSLPVIAPFSKRRKSTILTEPISQDGCMLLMMLPYELRELIYLSLVDERDWTIQLREVSEDKRERKKEEKKLKRGHIVPRKKSLHSFLNLMLVCQHIYAEARPLLFEKAQVLCPSLATFKKFITANSGLSAINSAPQWTQLRRFSLEVAFPYLLFSPREGGPKADKEDPSKIQYYNSETWTATCEALNQMTTLRSLKIGMYARNYQDWHPHWPDRPGPKLWETLVEPLLTVRRCSDFVVAVSWPVDEGENERGWPFVVQRKLESPENMQNERLEELDSDQDAASSVPDSWDA